VQTLEPFDPSCTLFIDDSVAVLRSARAYGFRWLLAVLRPDSTVPAREAEGFSAISQFSDLLPGLRDS
jgi:putative hydrolase of the HAD superfamily